MIHRPSRPFRALRRLTVESDSLTVLLVRNPIELQQSPVCYPPTMIVFM